MVLVLTSVTHMSPSLTASLAIIVPTRSPFFGFSKSQKSEHDFPRGLSLDREEDMGWPALLGSAPELLLNKIPRLSSSFRGSSFRGILLLEWRRLL